MFPHKYFAGRYFAPRYWPQGTGIIVVPPSVSRGCAHVADVVVTVLAIADVALWSVAGGDYALTTITLADEAC